MLATLKRWPQPSAPSHRTRRVAGHPQEVVFVYWFWWGIKCLVFMCIVFAGLPVWLILSIMDVFPMRWLAEKLDLDLL